MSSDAALRTAYDRGLDLVLMSAQSQPPVCRVMDYGKFRFEREKKEKEAKKKLRLADSIVKDFAKDEEEKIIVSVPEQSKEKMNQDNYQKDLEEQPPKR